MAKQPTTSSNNIQKILIGLIAVLVLVTVGMKVLNRSADGPALYSQHFQLYDLQLSKEAANPNNRIYQAEQAYHNGKYEDALAILQSFIRTQPNATDRLGIAAACCLLQMGQTAQAVTQLDQAIAKGYGANKSLAQWYKALALLRLGDVAAAKSIIEPMAVDSYAPNKKQAQELLKQL
ncbi:MAG: CDC27 family protein [Bacteroidota bacterium]